MTLNDAAAQENVKLGRLIIDVSIRDNLEAEFTIFAPRSTENRSVIAGLATGEKRRMFPLFKPWRWLRTTIPFC